MSFLLDLFKREKRETISEMVSAFLSGSDLDYPMQTSSGARVTVDGSLAVSTVYACVKLIAWTIAGLKFHVYRKTSTGRERYDKSQAHKLINLRPNPVLTHFDFMSYMLTQELLWGAGIAEIEFDRGKPVALWPLPTSKMTAKISEDYKDVVYELDLGANGKKIFFDYQLVIFKSLSSNLYKWCSPIELHRESVGYSMALSEYGNKTIGQGTNPAGILSMPRSLSENSIKSLKESMKQYEGLGNSHRLMFLGDDVKFQRVGLPPEDALYLESKKFSIIELCQIFMVPPHMVQFHEKSTSWGSGLEEMGTGFGQYTILPYLIQIAEEIDKKLIRDDSGNIYSEAKLDSLMRAKFTERYNGYKVALDCGFLNINEVRERENWNSIGPDGDRYRTSSSSVPVDEAEEVEGKGEKDEPDL